MDMKKNTVGWGNVCFGVLPAEQTNVVGDDGVQVWCLGLVGVVFWGPAAR